MKLFNELQYATIGFMFITIISRLNLCKKANASYIQSMDLLIPFLKQIIQPRTVEKLQSIVYNNLP